MGLHISSLLLTLALLVAQAFAQRLDSYGDPLPPGANLRLGSTRLAARGGFTWLPDGKTLVTARDGKLLFWEIPSGKLTKQLKTPIVQPNGVYLRYDLACSADGKKIVCGGRNGHFCVCDLETGRFVSSDVPKELHAYRMESIAMSPLGDIVAAVDDIKGEVEIWDAATCKLLRQVVPPKPADGSIAPVFTRDGKTLGLVGRGNSVLLLAVDGSRPPTVMGGVHDLRVHSLAISADGGRVITAGIGAAKDERDRTWGIGSAQVRVWDLATHKMLLELPTPPEPSRGGLVALAPDDKTLVWAHGERTTVWDLAKVSAIRALDEARIAGSHCKVSIDPQGKYVAAVEFNDEFVRVWDLATGKALLSPERRHSSYISVAAFSHDGKTIATGGYDSEVRLWNSQTGEHLRTIGNKGTVGGLAFHDKDRRVLVSGAVPVPLTFDYVGTLAAFDVATGKALFQTELKERGASLSLSPGGNLLAVAGRNLPAAGPGAVTLALFDPNSGKPIVSVPDAMFSGFENVIADFHWLADDKALLAACEDNAVRRIDVKTGKVLTQIAVPHLTIDARGAPVKASVQAAAFVSPERVVTGSMLGSELICWNLLTGAKLWTVQPPQVSVRKLAASPDGKLLACTSTIGREPYYTHLSLWDVGMQKQLADVELGQEDVYAMTFSPDSKRLLLCFTDGNALVYEVVELKSSAKGSDASGPGSGR